MLKQIATTMAPSALGPYAQAIVAGELLFCSGQIGLDPKTSELAKEVTEQTKQVMQNLTEVLKAADCDLTHIVKTTIYLTDMNNFSQVNEIYATFFPDHKPARATVGVASLPKGALVEIDAVAVLSNA